MKLIIDISKEVYNGIKIGMRNRDDMREIGEAVENGIPLDDVLDKIRAEITAIAVNGQVDEHISFIRTGEQVKQMALDIIDKYMAERSEE